MSIGGWPGIPQILAFLLLACCYPLFAWWALRPRIGRGFVMFTVIALGELCLAFPTHTESNPTSSAARAIATYSGQRTSRSTSGSWTPTRSGRGDEVDDIGPG